jgi:Phosphate/sulphate permeases
MLHPVAGLVVAIIVAVAFDVTNGFHDSANAIAALVVTRAARPGQAVVLASVFTLLGPVIAGTAVADTVGGIVTVDPTLVVPVVGAGLTGALVWNLLTWWRGLPSSSSHALVGGLVGAALVQGGFDAVFWGGFDGLRPVGVLGVLAALAVAPFVGFAVGFVGLRFSAFALRRARREIEGPIRRSEWGTAAALAFSHGTNDAQKTMGVITLLLFAQGEISSFTVPLWVKLLTATALTFGTSVGGWRIIRTIGRRIYPVRLLDGLVSQAGSAGVILVSGALGAPVSTSQVVASSVAGVGAGQRWRHVRWAIVREMAIAWVITLPASAALAAAALPLWRLLA